MLALTSTTGKLGHATLSALLTHSLLPPSQLIILTSTPLTSPKLTPYRDLGIQTRPFNFSSPSPSSFSGITKLFLVSTPEISLDFSDAAKGGRESVHIATIRTAISAGVKEIVYTSLAFGDESEAGVMRAHLRTEEFLKSLKEKGEVEYTIIREGLYNESWPLYLGYFDVEGRDERSEIVVAGDGKVSWTGIADLGVGNAVILADGRGRWKGKTVVLCSGEKRSLREIAGVVGKCRGREVEVKVVGREEYVEEYVGRERERDAVEWWSSTYGALEKGECDISDPTLEEILAEKGIGPKSVEETVKEMLS
ncbi:NAD(P)-binding protein [Mollisia scopiformis]|uniref:NAD(P)-binding protein n=1 Tax=Mollisia scopiformis TaxID=149040 RepID=A0A132BC29_MOLSC|nr:NAD(P)-binding protein [Mollisia scopiformis]KUJ09980.1 NAD(P)-binding protein [Mollisia scopiformis]